MSKKERNLIIASFQITQKAPNHAVVEDHVWDLLITKSSILGLTTLKKGRRKLRKTNSTFQAAVMENTLSPKTSMNRCSRYSGVNFNLSPSAFLNILHSWRSSVLAEQNILPPLLMLELVSHCHGYRYR